MAEPRNLQSTDVAIYIGGVAVGCAESADLTVDREMLEAVCKASGAWRTVTPGRMTWEGSIGALWRIAAAADEATNVTGKSIFNNLVNGTEIEIRFGVDDDSLVPDGYQFVGQAYINSFAPTSPVDGNQTWNASFTGNGELALVPLA